MPTTSNPEEVHELRRELRPNVGLAFPGDRDPDLNPDTRRAPTRMLWTERECCAKRWTTAHWRSGSSKKHPGDRVHILSGARAAVDPMRKRENSRVFQKGQAIAPRPYTLSTQSNGKLGTATLASHCSTQAFFSTKPKRQKKAARTNHELCGRDQRAARVFFHGPPQREAALGPIRNRPRLRPMQEETTRRPRAAADQIRRRS